MPQDANLEALGRHRPHASLLCCHSTTKYTSVIHETSTVSCFDCAVYTDMTGLSKKFKNEFGEDNLVEESLIIPARDPKQCVVRILKGKVERTQKHQWLQARRIRTRATLVVKAWCSLSRWSLEEEIPG